ncbi:MAG: hypothetical protein ACREQE_05730 [Candidatus Binataceae bacterium]
MLALVREIEPEIECIWIDDELEYPGHPEYVRDVAAALNVRLTMSPGNRCT